MSGEADFTRAITSSKLPKYRIDRSTGADANLTLEKPLLRDIMFDSRTAQKEQQAAGGGNATASSSSPASPGAGATSTSGPSDASKGGDQQQQQSQQQQPVELSAWRLQIRAIFFPRAHIIAQQRARRGETVAVLDQSVEWFELLSLFLTVANIVVVAVDDPTMPETAPTKLALDKFDTFFSLFYFFEMVIRIVSFGVAEFWADAFNRLDAVVVAFGITSLALKLTSSSLANITFVRALRVLRPLRTMTQFRQTRLTVASVIGSFRELLDVWLLFLVFFGVLCVLAIDPFRGVLRNHCFVDLYPAAFEGLPRYNSSYDRFLNQSTNSSSATTTTTTSTINGSGSDKNAVTFSPEQQQIIDDYNAHYRRAVTAVQAKVLEADDPLGLLSADMIGSSSSNNSNASWRRFLFYNLSSEPLKIAMRLTALEQRQQLAYISLLLDEERQEQELESAPYQCPAAELNLRIGTSDIYSGGCADRLCKDPIIEGGGRSCPVGFVCEKTQNPNYGFLSFDNIFSSALTTFVLLTTSAWAEIYTMMYDASTGLAGLYCVVAVIVGRYFVVSIIIAIVTDRFREKHRQQLMVMQAQEEATARASKRIRVKSLLETSLESLGAYFARLRQLEEIEIHHDFASALEEHVLVKRTQRDWDNFRFVDEDLYDTQASMIRRSASMAVLPSGADGGDNNNNNKDSDGASSVAASEATNKNRLHNGEPILTRKSQMSGNSSSSSSNNDGHYILDRNARRRRWFAREIVFQKWFLWLRVFASSLTLVWLSTEFEGVENLPALPTVRYVASFAILLWWIIELILRGLSRRWLLLVTDTYYVVELFCVLALSLSVLFNLGGPLKFGSLSESFFLGRVSVFMSESARITSLYRWVRIIVAAFRGSLVLICIIVLAVFLLACTGMQVFGAAFCSLERISTLEENIAAIEQGTCIRPRSNFDSFGNAMTSAFQILTGNEWHTIMYAGMQSIWNRNGRGGGGYVLVGIIALSFVMSFIVLNYLFANLFISILLNSRAVNEDELRREAIRIQREIHYEKLLARRQLQLEAGLYDVAAVASALFSFDKYFRGASLQSRRVMDALFSNKCAGRISTMRDHHVFSTLQVICTTMCIVGLAMAQPITPPDTPTHWWGSGLVHTSTVGFVFRLTCELIVESYKMRMKKIKKKQGKANDMFEMMEDEEDAAAAAAAVAAKESDDDDAAAASTSGGGGAGASDAAKSSAKKDDDAPLRERYAVFSYFARSYWHIVEGILTAAGVFFAISRIFWSTWHIAVFTASCILCFRPLCYMEKTAGLQAVLRDIAHMLRNLACIMTLIISFYFVYSLLGVQLLRGRMSLCHGNETIKVASTCASDGYTWGPVPLHFDDLPAASYTLYAVATYSDWTNIYYSAQAAGHTPFIAFLVNCYFFVFIIAGGMFAQALVTMMLIDTFEVRRLGATERVSKQDQVRAISDERFAVQQRLVAKIVPREVAEMRRAAALQRQLAAAGVSAGSAAAAVVAAAAAVEPQQMAKDMLQQPDQAEGLQGVGQRGLRVVQSTWFRNLIGTLVFLSFCVSASYRYPMSTFWSDFNYYADVIFTILFGIELALYLLLQAFCVEVPRGTKWWKKLPLRVSSGWVVHFSSKWNWFDAIIVLLSVLGLALEQYAEQWAWTKNFRALRALRLLRLVKNNPRIAGMVSRLRTAIKQLFFVSVIFAFSFVCFGLLGMRLFAHVKHDGTLVSDQVGFSHFVGSLLMMMRIATLNRWPAVTIALAVSAPDCDPNIGECGNSLVARTFMLVTTVVFGFVLSNMFVAVLVDAYMSKRLEGEVTSQIALTQDEISDFAEKFVTWPTMDPVYFTIPSEHVVPFLRQLRRSTLLKKKELLARGEPEAAAALRIHPFALPMCELRWRQPQWDLLAVQQLNLKEYSPGLVDYWSLINALCDLRFVREVVSRAGPSSSASSSTASGGATITVKAGVLERSKEKMLKRKFLLKVPARQQQLRKRKSGGSKKHKVDDDMDDNYDEEDEEVNPSGLDDAWDTAMNAQPRMLTEVYAVTRLRDVMLSMPKWRGFMLESTAVNESGGGAAGGGAGGMTPLAGTAASSAVGGSDGGAGLVDSGAFGVSETGLFNDASLALDGSLTMDTSHGHLHQVDSLQMSSALY